MWLKLVFMLSSVLLAYLWSVFFFGTASQGATKTVRTHFGLIKGYSESSRDGRPYWAFKGVPYAKSPEGKLRFEPPVPIEAWGENVLDARNLPLPCVQYDSLIKRSIGIEDCLKINFYVPEKSDVKTKLPILIFIHGGSYLYGSSQLYGPQYFMDHNAILITVHYRLGILGFLNTQDGAITGNLGLKDILEALRFVQKTISSFSGDPRKVTIFGESAGASLTHYLMLSNQTNGLINSAIVQSGSALSPWSFIKNPREQAFRVGRVLKCGVSQNSQELVKCLRSMDSSKFAEFHKNEPEFWSEKFGPSLEIPVSEEGRKNAFLLASPKEIAENGLYHEIPWIYGVVSNEGCILAHAIISNLDKINKDWNYMSTFLDLYNNTNGLELIRKRYFGSKRQFSQQDLPTFTKLVGDRQFFKGVYDGAKYHLGRNRKKPLFLYALDYEGRSDITEFGVGHLIRTNSIPFLPMEASLVVELLRIRIMDWLGINVPTFGTCHADELKFLFVQNPLLSISKDSPNYKFSKELISMWVRFAESGVPHKNWNPITNDDSKFFSISGLNSPNHLKMIRGPMKSDEVKFWDQFPS